MQENNKKNSINEVPNKMPNAFGMRGGRIKGPVEKPKNLKKTLSRLWMYFENEQKSILIVAFFVLIDSIILLFVPRFIGQSVDAISSKNGNVNFGLLSIMVVCLLIAYLSDTLLTFIQGWLMAGISQRIVKGLRKALFEKLQNLPVAFLIHMFMEIL